MRRWYRDIRRHIYDRNPVEMTIRNKVQKKYEMPRDKERKHDDKLKKLRLNYVTWIVHLAATQHDNSKYIAMLLKMRDHEVSKCVRKLKMPPDEKDAKFAGTPWVS